MKKTYKIKNYKGNLVESLSKFQKNHKGMKIVEAVEDGKDLKIKTEGKPVVNSSNYDDNVTPDLMEIAEPLKECFEKYAIWFSDMMRYPEEWFDYSNSFVEALKNFSKELGYGLENVDAKAEYEKLNKAIEKFEKDCDTYGDQWL